MFLFIYYQYSIIAHHRLRTTFALKVRISGPYLPDEPKSHCSSQLAFCVELFLELVLLEAYFDGFHILEDVGRPEPQLNVDWLD